MYNKDDHQHRPDSAGACGRFRQIWLTKRHMSSSSQKSNNDVEASSRQESPQPARFWTPFARRRHLQASTSSQLSSSQPELTMNQNSNEHSNIDPNGEGSKPRASFLTRSPLNKLKKLREDFRKCMTKLDSAEGVNLMEPKQDEDRRKDSKPLLVKLKSLELNHDEDDAEVDTQASMQAKSEEKQEFYLLDVHLERAQSLLAMDACGTSDPYVKFKIANQIVAKSRTIQRTLEPVWDEHFVLAIENVSEPVVLKVYDHDYLLSDDYLGSARLNLTSLDLETPTQLELYLHESEEETNNVDENWGRIFVTVKLNPKTLEDRDNFYAQTKNIPAVSPVKKTKPQLWQSVVNVLLLKGTDCYFDGDYCIRFKLANEKHKSKTMVKSNRMPEWRELFEMHLYADQSKVLEVGPSLANQSDFIVKVTIDLTRLAEDKTHRIVRQVDENGASIELLITITGCHHTSESAHLVEVYHQISPRYNVLHSFSNFSNVGHLLVRVIRAENLAAADINGKSDPFCVLELANERLQTPTEYKTLSPQWDRTFEFQVRDIHEVLYLTVYDQDKDRAEFLGRVAIPLLKIDNQHKQWFALKDKKLNKRAKGQVELQFWLSYNMIKASLRTFTPKETRYIQPEIKFKRSLFVRNVIRLKNCCLELMQLAQFVNSCLKWEKPVRSIVALGLFLVFVYYVELYMLPLMLLFLFAKSYVSHKFQKYFNRNYKEEDAEFIDETVEVEEEDGEERKSLKEKLQTIQDTSTLIMLVLGEVASFMERIKNSINFSVPFLSWLGMFCSLVASIILYMIPIRYLIMAWGVNKFFKKLLRPDFDDNNELVDFVSRAPNLQESLMFKPFRPLSLNEDQSPGSAGQSIREALRKLRSDSTISETNDKTKKKK